MERSTSKKSLQGLLVLVCFVLLLMPPANHLALALPAPLRHAPPIFPWRGLGGGGGASHGEPQTNLGGRQRRVRREVSPQKLAMSRSS